MEQEGNSHQYGQDPLDQRPKERNTWVVANEMVKRLLRISNPDPILKPKAERRIVFEQALEAAQRFDDFLSDVFAGRLPVTVRDVLPGNPPDDYRSREIIEAWRSGSLDNIEAVMRNTDLLRSYGRHFTTENLGSFCADVNWLICDLRDDFAECA